MFELKYFYWFYAFLVDVNRSSQNPRQSFNLNFITHLAVFLQLFAPVSNFLFSKIVSFICLLKYFVFKEVLVLQHMIYTISSKFRMFSSGSINLMSHCRKQRVTIILSFSHEQTFLVSKFYHSFIQVFVFIIRCFRDNFFRQGFLLLAVKLTFIFRS